MGTVSQRAVAAVHALLRRAGIDLVRYSPAHFFNLRRLAAIRAHGVTLVLDVGANEGQYARRVRADGYDGQILSFEPLPAAFAMLAASSASDDRWACSPLALGDADESTEINVSGNSWSSSLLAMEERHVAAAPESAYVARERVTVTRLDSVASSLIPSGARIFLKIDVQGFELRVLEGADAVLGQVQALEIELSFTRLYEGQPLMPDVVAYLFDRGFSLVSLEPAFSDPQTGELLQADGLFERRA